MQDEADGDFGREQRLRLGAGVEKAEPGRRGRRLGQPRQEAGLDAVEGEREGRVGEQRLGLPDRMLGRRGLVNGVHFFGER